MIKVVVSNYIILFNCGRKNHPLKLCVNECLVTSYLYILFTHVIEGIERSL
jgi:hypothetical protein